MSKKEENNKEDKSFGIVAGYKFGFGFFLAFLTGWIIVASLALIMSLVLKGFGINI